MLVVLVICQPSASPTGVKPLIVLEQKQHSDHQVLKVNLVQVVEEKVAVILQLIMLKMVIMVIKMDLVVAVAAEVMHLIQVLVLMALLTHHQTQVELDTRLNPGGGRGSGAMLQTV